jgi:hypothetical protein
LLGLDSILIFYKIKVALDIEREADCF